MAFKKVVIKNNICAGSSSARLVLYNYKQVESKLIIVLYTVTLPKLEATL
jgi:hypothetical protein